MDFSLARKKLKLHPELSRVMSNAPLIYVVSYLDKDKPIKVGCSLSLLSRLRKNDS